MGDRVELTLMALYILQITEALIYLHSTEHSMHGNVCPETILVAANGCWKLAGLDFVERSSNRVVCYKFHAEKQFNQHAIRTINQESKLNANLFCSGFCEYISVVLIGKILDLYFATYLNVFCT